MTTTAEQLLYRLQRQAAMFRVLTDAADDGAQGEAWGGLAEVFGEFEQAARQLRASLPAAALDTAIGSDMASERAV